MPAPLFLGAREQKALHPSSERCDLDQPLLAGGRVGLVALELSLVREHQRRNPLVFAADQQPPPRKLARRVLGRVEVPRLGPPRRRPGKGRSGKERFGVGVESDMM